MKRVIALLMENQPGALSRVVGLFSQRGYNIETLVVAPTNDATLSRLTMSTEGDEKVVEQITKQLDKLIDVVMVTNLSESEFVERELMLIKFTKDSFPENVFDESNIVSKDDEIINVQVVGTSSELDKLISEIDANNPLEIVRSGSLGISSDEKTLTIEN
jgi:acetolactate synthase-1/3 small subunit|tara:strand:+ start:2424 stop:2903 length:480 start_codon:yes stop_codon:yes gene_type:complete